MTAMLLCAALLQDTASWIRDLRHDDAEVREKAFESLVAAGEAALPALRRAAEETTDPDLRLQFVRLIARIEREAFLRTIEIAAIAAGDTVTITLTNRGGADVVVWPFVDLEVTDDEGVVIEPIHSVGRVSLRRRACRLEKFDFLTLAAGASTEIKTSLTAYDLDFERTLTWSLWDPGEYTLRFTWEYDRAALIRRCRCADAGHDAAEAPWNRAEEFRKSAEAKLTVGE